MAVIGLIVFLIFAGVIMVAVLFDSTPAPPSSCDNKKPTSDERKEEAAYRKFKKIKEREEQLKRFEKRYKKEKEKRLG